MSADEETELRDLVAQTLETNGVLGKIRAQLRASVFLALEEQEKTQNQSPFVNPEVTKFLNTKDGRQMSLLVREFLEFFNLDFSLSVFDPETSAGSHYDGRENLARDFDIIESAETRKAPLLAEVLKRGSSSSSGISRLNSAECPLCTQCDLFLSCERIVSAEPHQICLPHQKDMSVAHTEAAREKFNKYDKDQNGIIDKEELRCLFVDMFPNFNRNMLDRYVNEEFRASDKDFSNSIDYEEFLLMYKRLFVMCKSAVSRDIGELTFNSPRSLHEDGNKIPSLFKKNPERRSGSPCESLESHSSPRIPAPNSPLAKDSRLTREKSSDNSDSFFDEAPKYKSSISEQSKDIKGSHGNQSSMKGSRGQDASDADSFGKKLAELGLEVPDDDYDDDFESSNATPLGTTPRSARSDHNLKSIEDEEIQEEIDEDISVAEDLLKSDPSEVDDLTTDRTVSPTEGSTAAFDYMEDVIQHH